MVILLHRVHNTLAGSEVHRAFAGDCHSRGPPLRGMFTLALNCQLLVAPHIQRTLGEGLLVNLAALGRWRDGIKHATLSDPCLHPLGHQLVSVTGDGDARVLRLTSGAGFAGGNFLFCGLIWHLKKLNSLS